MIIIGDQIYEDEEIFPDSLCPEDIYELPDYSDPLTELSFMFQDKIKINNVVY